MRSDGCRLEVRLYDTLPSFRVAIVDNKTAYVGFYKGGTASKDSPQLVLDHHKDLSFFHPFQAHFERVWQEGSKEVDWDEY